MSQIEKPHKSLVDSSADTAHTTHADNTSAHTNSLQGVQSYDARHDDSSINSWENTQSMSDTNNMNDTNDTNAQSAGAADSEHKAQSAQKAESTQKTQAESKPQKPQKAQKAQKAQESKKAQSRGSRDTHSGRGIGRNIAVIARDLSRFITQSPCAVTVMTVFLLTNLVVRLLWDYNVFTSVNSFRVAQLAQAQSLSEAGAIAAVQSPRFPGHLLYADFYTLGGFGWLRSLGTIIIAPTIPAIIIGALALLCGIGIAERKLGWMQSLGAAVVSSTVGISSAFALYYAVYSGTFRWNLISHSQISLSVWIIVVGSVMAATACMSTVWQRRVSLVMYACALMLILYRGEVSDFALLLTAFIGQMYGFMVTSNTLSSVVAKYKYVGAVERRRILAAIYLALALGPIVSMVSKLRVGPLAVMGTLLSPDSVTFSNANACANDSLRADCILIHRATGTHAIAYIALSVLVLAVMAVIAWGLFHGRRAALWSAMIMDVVVMLITASFYIFLPIAHLWEKDLSLYERLRFMTKHGGVIDFFLIMIVMIGFIIALAVNSAAFEFKTSKKRLFIGAGIIGSAGIVLAGLCFWITEHGLCRSMSAGWVSLYPLETLMNLMTYFFPMGFLRQTWEIGNSEFNTPTEIAVMNACGPVFWVIVIAVLLWWFKFAHMKNQSEHTHVDAVVEKGGESMSFMATWDDNEYWFTEDGTAAVAYRVYFNVAIAVTGPLGPAEKYEEALIGFSQFCEQRGWTPVMYSVHDSQREILESWGWKSLDVGTEMIIDPRQWQTTGKKWQDIRTAINKAKREGITDVLTTYHDAPASIREQIVSISEEWTEEKSLPEMKFTLGGVEELLDPRVKILYAIDEQGVVQAVTSWLPTYRDGVVIGWTLDFMRHRSDSMKGVMEFLIARMAERLHDEYETDDNYSVEFLSLSAAPLSGVEVHEGQSELLSHVLQLVARLLEPAYGFSSLFFFKKKFQPLEQHVYVVYPDSSRLAQISLAISHAYLPHMNVNDLLTLINTMRG